MAVTVGGGAAVHALVGQAHAPDDQGQESAALRALRPFSEQVLAIMIPDHPDEGLPVKGADELGHLAAFHADVSQLHQRSGIQGRLAFNAALRALRFNGERPPRHAGALGIGLGQLGDGLSIVPLT